MRKSFYAVLLVASAACNNTANQTAPANDNAEIENVKIVNTLFEKFNAHDWNGMATLYADTAEVRDPSFGIKAVQQTKKQTTDKYTELNKLFPDIRDSITAVYPFGKKHVIVEFISTGTGPDGKKFTLPICNVITIENGKIIKDYTYYDNSGSQ